MFKSLVFYAINGDDPPPAFTIEASLARATFTPPMASQFASGGWTSPRGEHSGRWIEQIGRHYLAAFLTETKILPAEVIKRETDKRVDVIKEQTGRMVGKRQRRELTEEVTLELLPKAFARRQLSRVWINPRARFVAVEASSFTKADVIAAALAAAAPRMNLHPLRVRDYPDATLREWMLSGEPPSGFTIDRDAVLESAGDDPAVVRYQAINLDAPDVREHLRGGKVPTRVALTFDARVSFLLLDDLRIQQIRIADVAFMENARDGEADAFDADAAIACGELEKLVAELELALGGRAALPVEEAADDKAARELERLARENGTTMEIRTSAGETLLTFGEGEDPLYPQACDVVRRTGSPTISGLQRELSVGYNRAARLLERMEAAGLVSAADVAGRRTVTAPDDVGATS